MKKIFRIAVILVFLACRIGILHAWNNPQEQDKKEKTSFTFIFLTDIHLQPERNATQGFLKAIEKINQLHPDFVITGGDLIMDALGEPFSRADSLYNLYLETQKYFKMPVYNTMGNHEIFGIYRQESGVDKSHPEYGEQMFVKRIGSSYYSFDHKGWHFMILNSVEDTGNESYIGLIDDEQIEWIKQDIAGLDKQTPIVISTHIPFFTVYSQIYETATTANDSSLVIINAKEVYDLFKNYNLKLVLQGHLHTVEDISVNGTHFITGGAVSAEWWRGPHRGFEEGFVLIKVKNNNFDWEYIDYGWEVNKEE
ncbi:MAG: metallophosphoesterase [Bacteroidetes bacterium]|nr:metallophosphoesterase [Bacteroidota bacterium]MCK4638776.1 metallophosphoesterase [Bacteroidales bacterium]